jgi:hypothetical protein
VKKANNLSVSSGVKRVTTTLIDTTYTDRGHLFMHQLDLAQREDWRRDFQSCMQNLHKHYSYTHVHDVTSIAAILVEVTGADAVRNLTAASTSIPERTKAVNSFVSSILRSAKEYETDEDTATKKASAVASDSESSANTRRSRCKTNNKNSRNNRSSSRGGRYNRSHSRGGRRDHGDSNVLKCKHCKKANLEPTHLGIAEDAASSTPKTKGGTRVGMREVKD